MSEYQGDGQRLYPSSTAGDGRIRRNSARTGRGQGRGSSRRMVECRQCGFLCDASKVARGGGTYSGDGGLGPITKTTTTGTTLAGASLSETHGDRSVPAGSGCPMCGSKNWIAS